MAEDFKKVLADALKEAERKVIAAHERQVQKAKIPALDDSSTVPLVEPTVIDAAGPESPDPVPQHGLLLETAVPRFSTEEKTKSGDMLLGGIDEDDDPLPSRSPRNFQLWSTYTKMHSFTMCLKEDDESDDLMTRQDSDEFAKELEMEKTLLAQSRTPWWVLSPNSPKRIGWDPTGVLVLLYDLIMIPMYTAFPLAPNTFLDLMTGVTLGFWTLDILACFCVGYYARDGTLVVSLRKIARQYVFTWFPLDVVIVSIDWVIVLALISEEEGKSAGLMRAGKMLRALRVLRTLRLLRLAKLRQLLNKLQDQVDSEHISVLLDIVKLLILIIFINHFIACAWYLVGCNPPSKSTSWLEVEFSSHDCEDANDELLLYKYTTSMHWSLTQFTPASMSVQPTNTMERSFAIGVLLFALLVFSSFVASLTGATTSLRKMTGRHSSQLWLLRKFLRQREITLDLQVRINRYINVVLTTTEKSVQYSDVHLFNILSGPLHNELRTELNKPRLMVHPFFVNMLDKFEALMRKVCFKVPNSVSLSRGDILFSAGEEGKSMYFLHTGKLDYLHHETKEFDHVGANEWFCEVVLWTPWVCQGRARARTESELMELQSDKFREVASEYPKHIPFMRMYGLQFLSQLQELYVEHGHHLTDLDMKISASEKMTDFLQLELAADTDDLQTVTSAVSSFMPWSSAKSPQHQTSQLTQGPRYVRAKSKMRLTVSDAGSTLADEHSEPLPFEDNFEI